MLQTTGPQSSSATSPGPTSCRSEVCARSDSTTSFKADHSDISSMLSGSSRESNDSNDDSFTACRMAQPSSPQLHLSGSTAGWPFPEIDHLDATAGIDQSVGPLTKDLPMTGTPAEPSTGAQELEEEQAHADSQDQPICQDASAGLAGGQGPPKMRPRLVPLSVLKSSGRRRPAGCRPPAPAPVPVPPAWTEPALLVRPPAPPDAPLTCPCWEAGICINAPCSIPGLCDLRTKLRVLGLYVDDVVPELNDHGGLASVPAKTQPPAATANKEGEADWEFSGSADAGGNSYGRPGVLHVLEESEEEAVGGAGSRRGGAKVFRKSDVCAQRRKFGRVGGTDEPLLAKLALPAGPHLCRTNSDGAVQAGTAPGDLSKFRAIPLSCRPSLQRSKASDGGCHPASSAAGNIHTNTKAAPGSETAPSTPPAPSTPQRPSSLCAGIDPLQDAADAEGLFDGSPGSPKQLPLLQNLSAADGSSGMRSLDTTRYGAKSSSGLHQAVQVVVTAGMDGLSSGPDNCFGPGGTWTAPGLDATDDQAAQDPAAGEAANKVGGMRRVESGNLLLELPLPPKDIRGHGADRWGRARRPCPAAVTPGPAPQQAEGGSPAVARPGGRHGADDLMLPVVPWDFMKRLNRSAAWTRTDGSGGIATFPGRF